jgi:hypothetical protein
MPCLAPSLFRFLLRENEEDAVVEMSLQTMPESETKFMLIEVNVQFGVICAVIDITFLDEQCANKRGIPAVSREI